MKINKRRNLSKLDHFTFKIKHFYMLLIALEKMYHDYWYLIREDIKIMHGKELLRLVDKIYEIIRNREPIEQQIYRNVFSWRTINQFLGLNRKDYNDFAISVNPYDVGEVDDIILIGDLEFVNKLHNSEQVELDDLSLLQYRNLLWSNSFKDYVFDEVLFFREEKITELTLGELDIILSLIEEVLKVELISNNCSDLTNAKTILIEYFDSFYSLFDFIITP